MTIFSSSLFIFIECLLYVSQGIHTKWLLYFNNHSSNYLASFQISVLGRKMVVLALDNTGFLLRLEESRQIFKKNAEMVRFLPYSYLLWESSLMKWNHWPFSILVVLYMILSQNPTDCYCKTSFPHTDKILWEE